MLSPSKHASRSSRPNRGEVADRVSSQLRTALRPGPGFPGRGAAQMVAPRRSSLPSQTCLARPRRSLKLGRICPVYPRRRRHATVADFGAGSSSISMITIRPTSMSSPPASKDLCRLQTQILSQVTYRRSSGARHWMGSRRIAGSCLKTAVLLGVAERTVRAWRRAKILPQTVATAVRAFDADSTVFAAHYRPATSRPRGRPRRNPGATGTRCPVP